MCSHSKATKNLPFAQILMSINSVVMSVAASYRTLKRGAVTFRHTIFIYLSLLCQVRFSKPMKDFLNDSPQVLARILSFLMLYLFQRKFFPAVS